MPAHRRKPSTRRKHTPRASPSIVAVLNPVKGSFELEITPYESSEEGYVTKALAATVDVGLPPNTAVMKSSAAKRVNSEGVEAVEHQNEVVKLASGRLEPVVGKTMVKYWGRHAKGQGYKNLFVYVVDNLECDMVLRNVE